MKASRVCWLALCLLLSGFSMELMAQKNLEAVVQKCKSDKSVDKSIVTKRDPKTKELQKIISSFTIEDNPTLPAGSQARSLNRIRKMPIK